MAATVWLIIAALLGLAYVQPPLTSVNGGGTVVAVGRLNSGPYADVVLVRSGAVNEVRLSIPAASPAAPR